MKRISLVVLVFVLSASFELLAQNVRPRVYKFIPEGKFNEL